VSRLAVLVVIGLVVAACGGSASETPFPQSAAEMTSDPVLRRPRGATSATPFTPRQPQRDPRGR
jgi:hypothetical protein